MTEPFRWKNCFADVVSSKYGPLAHAFLREVVEPSLTALDRQIIELRLSDDPVAAFIQADVEELRRATIMAFCLSIQSLWERQIRAYLQGCARQLRADDGNLAKKAMTARWEDIDNLFNELRGISLKEFPGYLNLDLLHLLGNACRHGDGPSLKALSDAHPVLWLHRDSVLDDPLFSPTIDGLVITPEILRTSVAAITSFWDETEYIYNESIERKHPALEAKLIEMRQERERRGGWRTGRHKTVGL